MVMYDNKRGEIKGRREKYSKDSKNKFIPKPPAPRKSKPTDPSGRVGKEGGEDWSFA
jgi:hypothetical protein